MHKMTNGRTHEITIQDRKIKLTWAEFLELDSLEKEIRLWQEIQHCWREKKINLELRFLLAAERRKNLKKK